MNYQRVFSRIVPVFASIAFSLSFFVAASPQASVLVPADPAVVWGKLDSGLSYAVMPNARGTGRVSLLLQVKAGSFEETGSQLGAAHLLQHMAFAGTTHYSSEELGKKLQELHFAGNPHALIVPGLDDSVYRLDLPAADGQSVSTGLSILSDWPGGMLLPEGGLTQARESLRAELLRRNTPEERSEEAIAAVRYSGTVIGQRLPLGSAESVVKLDRGALKDYYDTWYRPENMVLIVVGDVDPRTVGEQVRAAFGGLADRAASRPRPDLSGPALGDQPTFLVRTEPDAIGSEVLVERTMVAAAPVDTLDRERDGLRRQIAADVFRRRIQAIVEHDADSPLANASMFSHYGFGRASLDVRASARDKGLALPSLELALAEYRRLLKFGPTDAELQLEREAVAADLDAGVANAASRDNVRLANEIKNDASSGLVFQSPGQRRDTLRPILASITREEVVASLNDFGARPGSDFVAVTGRDDLGAHAEEVLRTAYVHAMNAPVAAPLDAPANAWAYGELTDPPVDDWLGERTDEAAAGIKVLWSHPNGLRMQVRRSGVPQGQVLVSLRFEIGNYEMKQHRLAGIGELIERGLVPGGLGKHTAAEVNALFAGSSVEFTGVHVSDDAVTYTASCNRRDLVRALQLLRAYYGDPGWRKDAEGPVKQAWLGSLAARKHDVDAQVNDRVQTVMAGSYDWRRPVTPAEVQALTFADAQTWLDQALDNAILTVTVVGDVPNDAVHTVARWFGHYKVKARFMMASSDDARATALEAPAWTSHVERITVEGPEPKGVVDVLWPTDDTFDIERVRRLDVLAQCLANRLQTRLTSKLTGEVSVKAWNTASDTFRGEGQLHVIAHVAPGQAEQALSLIRSEAVDLANHGVRQEVFEAAKLRSIKTVEEEKRSNAWWLSTVLPYSGWQPFRIAWATDADQQIQAVQTADVNALAQTYLKDSRVFAVVGVSAKTLDQASR